MKLIQITIAFIFIYGCGGSPSSQEDGHNHAHGGGPEGNSVILSPNQMATLNLTLDSIQLRNISDVIQLTGVISVPPQSRADVASPAEGIIQEINVSEGQTIKKGQTLFVISHPSFIQTQQEFLESRTQLSYLKTELERQKILSENNVNAKKILQQTESEFKLAQIRSASLEKQLQLLGINSQALSESNIQTTISVKAPLSGTISHISASLGSSVQFASVVMSIVDNSEAMLDVFVFEQDLASIELNQEAMFTLSNLPNRSYKAKIQNIGSTFENDSKAIKVRAVIESSKEGLIEGMSANVVLARGAHLVPSVPEMAIVNHQGGDFIFIYSESMQNDLLHAGHDHEDEHNHAEGEHAAEDHDAHETEEPVSGSIAFMKVGVKKGATAGGFSEVLILQSIPSDAKIVTVGAFYVLAAITNQGEAHSH